jgi:hypothetical protein
MIPAQPDTPLLRDFFVINNFKEKHSYLQDNAEAPSQQYWEGRYQQILINSEAVGTKIFVLTK